MRRKKERDEALLPSAESEDTVESTSNTSIIADQLVASGSTRDVEFGEAPTPEPPRLTVSLGVAGRPHSKGTIGSRSRALSSKDVKNSPKEKSNFFQKNVSDLDDTDSDGIFEDPGVEVNLPDFSVAALPKLDASELSGSQSEEARQRIGSYNPKRSDGWVFADDGQGVVDNHDSLPTPYSQQGQGQTIPDCLEPPSYEDDDYTARKSPVFQGFTGMDKTEGSIARKCAACQIVIDAAGAVVNGRYYHQTCVKCSACGITLTNGNTVLSRDKFLCRFCATQKPDAKRCVVCNLMIEKPDAEVHVDDMAMHKDCLCCYSCGKRMRKGEERLVSGVIVCGLCSVQTPKCAKCGERVFGPCVRNHGKVYHLDHWTCSVCGEVLSPSLYIMHHNKPFCLEHGEIYRTTCAFCKCRFKYGELDKIKWKKKYYHSNCFVCRVCGVDLQTNKCKAIHGRPHCLECFSQRVKDGDCNGDGRTVKNHRHHPMEAVERKERYHTELGRSIIHPIYGKPEFEEMGEVQRDFAIDVD